MIVFCVARKHMGIVENILWDCLINRKHMVEGPLAKPTFLIVQDLVMIHVVMGVTKFLWT